MSENRSKVIAIVEGTLLAALVLQADRYLPESHADENPVTVVTPSKSEVILDWDVLRACRQSDGSIDSSCAAGQAIHAISVNDSVEAGMWSYHVTNPSEQLRSDRLELLEAQEAARAKKTGECLVWSSRVMAPELRLQLPACD